MPLKESEAIILRSYPMGEGDRLVSFLDRQVGRLRGVARGARMPKSRFGSTLEMLSYVRIWYFEQESRDLVRINQCELLESFVEAQRDYHSGVLLATVSELTEAILEEREAADAQFRLILVTARAIRDRGASALVLAYFALWTVRLAGWLGSFEQCARCGKAIADGPGYATITSGLLCASCGRGKGRKISRASLEIIGRMISTPLYRLPEEKRLSASAREISAYALDIAEHHLEKKLVTRPMLEFKETWV